MFLFLDKIWRLVLFFMIQYALGRRGSFPYGILMKFSLLQISILVIISDILQTILLLKFFNFFFHHNNWIKRLKARFKKFRPGKKKERWKKLKSIGPWGLFILSAFPFGGGALSGSLLAISLKMDKRKAFFIIIAGCIVSTTLYYLGFAGILSIFKVG